MTTPTIEMTVQDVIRLAFPEPLRCAAECDHGCDIPLEPGQDSYNTALEHGWTLVLWRQPDPTTHHIQHAVFFCQPQCHYEWLKARMLAEPRYVPLLPEMDARAAHLAQDIAQHRHHREH